MGGQENRPLVPLGLFVLLTNTASSVSTINQNNTKDSGGTTSQADSTIAGGAASPLPPNKNKNGLSFSKEFKADTVYNKNGVRVDYEYNGNGTGNVHLHTKGAKYHYDTQGYLRMGPNSSDPLAPPSVQRLLYDATIQKAIMKGLRILRSLGGY